MAWVLLFTVVPLLAAAGLVMLLGASLARIGAVAVVGVLGFAVWVVLTRAFGADPATCNECSTTIADTEVRYATLAGVVALGAWFVGVLLGSVLGAVFKRGESAGWDVPRDTPTTTR